MLLGYSTVTRTARGVRHEPLQQQESCAVTRQVGLPLYSSFLPFSCRLPRRCPTMTAQVFSWVSGIQPLMKTGPAERVRDSAPLPLLFSPGASVQGLNTGEAWLLRKPPQDPQHWPNGNVPSSSCSRTGQAPFNTLFFIITCRDPTCTFLLSSLPITRPGSLEHTPQGLRGKTPFSYYSSSKGRHLPQEFWAHFPLKPRSLVVTLCSSTNWWAPQVTQSLKGSWEISHHEELSICGERHRVPNNPFLMHTWTYYKPGVEELLHLNLTCL